MVNSNDFLTVRKHCIYDVICNATSTASRKAEHKRFEVPDRNHEKEHFVCAGAAFGKLIEENGGIIISKKEKGSQHRHWILLCRSPYHGETPDP
jgi:hypothetical protein